MTGKETKTCFRSYTAWQYQEEVDWMNKMAAEGWALERTNGFVHHFSRCEPEDVVYQLDYNPEGLADREIGSAGWIVRPSR